MSYSPNGSAVVSAAGINNGTSPLIIANVTAPETVTNGSISLQGDFTFCWVSEDVNGNTINRRDIILALKGFLTQFENMGMWSDLQAG